MANIKQIYIGKDKLELRLNKNVYGFIEPHTYKHSPFILKYYYKDVYQGCDFSDNMEEGIERLSEILKNYKKPLKKMNEILKFDNFIFEGRYNKMTGILVEDILEEIKVTKENWSQEEEDFETIHLATYSGTLDQVDLYLNIRRITKKDEMIGDDFNIFNRQGFFMEGFCVNVESDFDLFDLFDDGSITLNLTLNPNLEPQIYSKILPELHDTIRHEIEHLTQNGRNKIDNKIGSTSSKLRTNIRKSGNYYLYYLLKDELPALVQGMYKQAKFQKKTIDEIFNIKLEELIERDIINKEESDKLFRIWSNYTKKHIPNAKWKD